MTPAEVVLRPQLQYAVVDEGDSVLIVDPSHSRHGQSAVVSSITPSRQYIVARFDDTGTTRSLHADAVVKQNAW